MRLMQDIISPDGMDSSLSKKRLLKRDHRLFLIVCFWDGNYQFSSAYVYCWYVRAHDKHDNECRREASSHSARDP